MTSSPENYSAMVLLDDHEDNDIFYVPFGKTEWNGDLFPVAVLIEEHGFSLALISKEGQESAHELKETYTRRDVIIMYISAVYQKCTADDLELKEAAIAVCDPHVARMLYDDACESGDPIQYLKDMVVAGTVYHLVTDLLDSLLERYAIARLCDIKARIIQDKFRTAIADPSYEMCRRRLMHEFGEMVCF